MIPKGTYKTNPDVPVVAVANLLVVSDSMSETLAHDITRLLFEKQRSWPRSIRRRATWRSRPR